ncbi:Uncharacterised protein [Enterobacter cloacae]|nr:Uncharacterised protein [Enterobacter cloacae]
MNNTTPIKALTAAVLLTFGFGLAAHAAPVNKGASEMNHEQKVSDTLSARQQAIPWAHDKRNQRDSRPALCLYGLPP